MPRKPKITYDNISDQKISFDVYNNLSRTTNSEKLKSQCEVLKLIIKEQLTPKQREILNMYYSLNLNIPEISKKTGKNKSTISRSLKSSQKKIGLYMRYNSFR